MSLIDTVKDMSNKVMGSKDSGQETVVASVYHLITNQGGLNQLIEKFQSNDELKNIVNSWIGKGKNLPINTEQLKSALGAETTDHLAKNSGLSENSLLSQLSKALPGLIDKLTPAGSIDNNQPTLEHLVMAGMALFKGKDKAAPTTPAPPDAGAHPS